MPPKSNKRRAIEEAFASNPNVPVDEETLRMFMDVLSQHQHSPNTQDNTTTVGNNPTTTTTLPAVSPRALMDSNDAATLEANQAIIYRMLTEMQHGNSNGGGSITAPNGYQNNDNGITKNANSYKLPVASSGTGFVPTPALVPDNNDANTLTTEAQGVGGAAPLVSDDMMVTSILHQYHMRIEYLEKWSGTKDEQVAKLADIAKTTKALFHKITADWKSLVSKLQHTLKDQKQDIAQLEEHVSHLKAAASGSNTNTPTANTNNNNGSKSNGNTLQRNPAALTAMQVDAVDTEASAPTALQTQRIAELEADNAVLKQQQQLTLAAVADQRMKNRQLEAVVLALVRDMKEVKVKRQGGDGYVAAHAS